MSDNNLAMTYELEALEQDDECIYVDSESGDLENNQLNSNTGDSVSDHTHNVSALCPKLDVEYLFRSRYQQLKGFIRKRIHNDYDVEDIVQSTYVEAIKKAENFKGLSRPDVWLFGIALNLVRNHAKKEKNRTRMWEEQIGSAYAHSDSQSAPQYIELDNNPCNEADRTQQISIIDATLASLPKDMKQVFQSIVIDNKSYQEAAKLLGIPTGTVRSRLSRVRDKFKEAVSI